MGREVRHVRDVKLADDLVIMPDEEEWHASSRGQQFQGALDDWRATKHAKYVAMTEVMVPKAVGAWRTRSGMRTRVQ